MKRIKQSRPLLPDPHVRHLSAFFPAPTSVLYAIKATSLLFRSLIIFLPKYLIADDEILSTNPFQPNIIHGIHSSLFSVRLVWFVYTCNVIKKGETKSIKG